MNIATGICVLALFASLATSLDPAQFQTCTPNQRCSQRRGLIHFDWNTLPLSEKIRFNGRSWIIQPPEGLTTTVTLVFKDYNVRQSMYVAMNSDGRIKWQKIQPHTSQNFEMLVTNATSVTVYVPASERGRFHAFYFAGCDILTAPSSEIMYPELDQTVNFRSTCWIVKPAGVRNVGRFYISLRDVYLMKGASITIGELHSDKQIAQVDRTVPYEVFSADASNRELVLIDLECGDDLGTCDGFGNVFSASYYTVNTNDVACIEIQKHCALDPWYLPQPICSRFCPALDNIVDEELEKEGPVQKIAILKSAGSTAKPNATEEPETEEGEEDEKTKQTKKAKSKPIRCQVKRKYCKCLKTQDDAKKYCFSKRKCKAFGNCAVACMWSRVILCAKITSSASIKLLSG